MMKIRQTRQLKKKFLEHYRKLCVIGKAAEAAGIDRSTVYLWNDQDKQFRTDFGAAKKDVIENLEAEAIRRAYKGVLKPVYQGGKKVGIVREYSDTLLIFLLKGAAPEKYRENSSVDLTSGGKPIESVVRVVDA